MISWMEKERRKINKNDIRVWDGKSASNDIFLATRSRLSAGKNRARAYERFVTFSKTTSRPGSPTFSHLRASILGVRLHMHGMLLLTDKHPWRSKRSKTDRLPSLFLWRLLNAVRFDSNCFWNFRNVEFFILSLLCECIINRIKVYFILFSLNSNLNILARFSFFGMKKFQNSDSRSLKIMQDFFKYSKIRKCYTLSKKII